MSNADIRSRRFERIALAGILLLFVGISTVGSTWGLPSRAIDKYLFGDSEPWSGKKIHRLAGAGEKFSPDRGADVDVDPLDDIGGEPIVLTATEQDIAKIYLRYRLYTHQPDEMITMMALAGMRPGRLNLDPRLYQYGGLFIYPVGALIKLCGMIGLIDVRSDVVYYLDNPDEFGKFYVVARAYAVSWGLVGVFVVFGIGRRLCGSRAGVLAALLFTLMPVVVCMAHEGKPHLPGAVLMLLAVYFAMRHLSTRAAGFGPRGASRRQEHLPFLRAGSTTPPDASDGGESRRLKPAARGGVQEKRSSRDWWLMCTCCGAAFGMVLSSLPVFVLIPLVALLDGGARTSNTDPSPERKRRVDRPRAGAWGSDRHRAFALRTLGGIAVAGVVYLLTNPYIVINAFVNREVLRSNFDNSLAMYDIARIGEGFVRVIELTAEGATWPILALGANAFILGVVRKNRSALPLVVVAAVFFLQFVLIGAGKPAEYGRFGIFTNTALAIGASCLLVRRWGRLPLGFNAGVATLVAICTAFLGGAYVWNFRLDALGDNARARLSKSITRQADVTAGNGDKLVIGVLADPAPYSCPALDFSRVDVALLESPEQLSRYSGRRRILIHPTDRTEQDLSDVPREQLPRLNNRWEPLRDTPISWANKPFHVYWPDPFQAPEDER